MGLLFAFAIVVGGEVYRTNSIAGLAASPVRAFLNIALFALIAIAASLVMLALSNVPAVLEKRSRRKPPALFAKRKGMFAIWAFVFITWVPCLLAYWPGSFAYDIPTQTEYVLSGNWTTQQPPIHTLIWAIFLQMEGFLGLKAITWYELAQMLFLSSCFAASLRFLAQRGVNVWLWIAALLFFSVNPVMALFSITPVKDTLLAGVLCLLVIEQIKLVQDPGTYLSSWKHYVGFGCCIVACCLLRSNMLVAVAVFALIMFVLMRANWKKAAVFFGAPLLVTLAIVGPVYSAVGISSGSSAIASVPFEQVINVARNHKSELSAQDRATIRKILPLNEAIRSYNPRFADSVVRLFKGKDTGAAALRNELADFARLWIEFIGRYPVDCIDAFLSLNIPYWYPAADTPDPYSKRAYIETSIWKEAPGYPVAADSKAPHLREAYERVADFSVLSVQPLKTLFSPSTVIWVLIVSCFLLYSSAFPPRKRCALVVLLPLLFWASFLIGPVSNMRYVFPLFSLYPILLCTALLPKRMFEK